MQETRQNRGLMLVGLGLEKSPVRRAEKDTARHDSKPADIPVERLIKLELLISLKSGKIVGPKIPEKLLALAGEAIE